MLRSKNYKNNNNNNLFLQNRKNNNGNNNFLQQRYNNNNNNYSRNLYNNNNNRQLNPRRYTNFNLGQFKNHNKQYEKKNPTHTEIICNYCKKPGHLVRDCEIRPNKKLQSPDLKNSKVLPSTGVLRNA